MILLALAALLMGTPPESDPPQLPSQSQPQKLTPQQIAEIQEKEKHFLKQLEPARQRAIKINDLAGSIHSEADARALVDAVAEELSGHRHLLWTARSIRHRVAHAEYEAAADSSLQIPEQRVVDVWNEYVREIDAPVEALITAAELHNLRDSMYVGASHFAWKRQGSQSLWTMPNIYALDADGNIASGCRALEALKIIHDMHEMFSNVRSARERVAKGVTASALIRQREQNPTPQPAKATFSNSMSNPVGPAAYRYQQAHGEHAYEELLRRLFDELFPAG